MTATPYNADFDGDEMNLHCPQGPGRARHASPHDVDPAKVIGAKANKPMMGTVQDSLLGAYLLTDPELRLHQARDRLPALPRPLAAGGRMRRV